MNLNMKNMCLKNGLKAKAQKVNKDKKYTSLKLICFPEKVSQTCPIQFSQCFSKDFHPQTKDPL